MPRTPLRPLSLALSLALAGCNERPPPPPRPAPSAPPSPRVKSPVPEISLEGSPRPGTTPALIRGIPHVRQKPDFCGEACAEMVLSWLGRGGTQDDVFDLAGIEPELGRGAITPELKRGLTTLGFKVGDVWHHVDAARGAEELTAHFAAIYADLLKGYPAIVCMHYDDGPRTTEHFRLIVGYDPETDEVIYHEPAEDDGAYRRMKRTRMLRLWPLVYDPATWTLIRFRLEPDPAAPRPAAIPKVHGHSPAEYAQHVLKLKEKLGPGYSVAIEPPFVVAGDGPEEKVREYAESLVSWAKQKLTQDFFRKEPEKILDVLLFTNARTYRKKALDLFGSEPTTPYGYYTSQHGALVMNIATGGGTLIHEIVHPYVEADFPAAPPWLNEGLGSLFEQSDEREGHIVGLPNWRLPSLQAAIAEHRMTPLSRLLESDTHAFYDEDPGTNYAAARYLCYYLQEKGLLVRFYRDFRDRQAEDPTGTATLKAVLGESDLTAFQPRWEAFVSKLRFRRP
jgi:Peptidase_C39 like family